MQCRALGDYAEQGGNKDAKKLVDDFFITSQDFDFTLFQAKRYNEPVGEKSDAALQKNAEALQRCAPNLCLQLPPSISTELCPVFQIGILDHTGAAICLPCISGAKR